MSHLAAPTIAGPDSSGSLPDPNSDQHLLPAPTSEFTLTATPMSSTQAGQNPLVNKLRARNGAVEPKVQVHKIVLTGGPCAGKTTGLARVAAYLMERGFNVFTVPEAATLLFANGAKQFDETTTDEQRTNFQITLMNLQMSLEDTFYRLALNGQKPAVLLCDRGVLDGSAYISAEEWQRVLNVSGFNMLSLRDKRYDLVLHLVTAAIGAETNYTLENNYTRTEGIDAARALDLRLQEAWIGHPHLTILDNHTGFEAKMQRLVDCVGRLVGLPQTKKHIFKYLVPVVPDKASFPVKVEEFEVEKVYLRGSQLQSEENSVADDVKGHEPHGAHEPCALATAPYEHVVYTFVRCRSQGGLSSFSQTTLLHIHECVNGTIQKRRVEKKIIINSRSYAYAVAHLADPARNQLKQRRLCFLWEGSYYTVVEYQNVKPGLCILYYQHGGGDAEVKLPPFVQIEKEVTSVGEYSSYHLSTLKTDQPAE